MRVIVFALYLFAFLLDSGNDFHSELHQGPNSASSNPLIERQYPLALFDTIDVVDVVEDYLPDLIEENSSEENEDENGKPFPQKNGIQHKWFLRLFEQFFVSIRFTSSLPLGGTSAPIYLSNRVLRI